MRVQQRSAMRVRLVAYAVLGVALVVAGVRFIDLTHAIDLRQSPLAYDWKILWDATRDGHVQWDAACSARRGR